MFTRIADMYRDVRTFGPGVLNVHVGRIMGTPKVKVRPRGMGELTVRCRDSDLEVLRQVFVRRQYQLPSGQAARLDDHYRRMLSAGQVPVIIDAGANIGAASIWFARLFPEAEVLAVEPDGATAEVCRQNTAACPRVTVLNRAIGGTGGHVTLVPGDHSWAIQTTRANGAGNGSIKVVTVADLVQSVGDMATLFIAKIDIEGFEADLFSAGTEWTETVSAIFIEPHDWLLPGEGSSRSMQRVLFGAGFEVIVCGENLVLVRDEPKRKLN